MPSGDPYLSPTIVEPVAAFSGSPARAKMSHENVGSVQSAKYRHVMMWPYTLLARGLAASVGGFVPVPRRVLLVRVAMAVNECGKVSIHSGRSIRVAPAASAAPRVLIKMSAS